MKKLLLGIAALAAALSPSLSAQTTSELRFTGWRDENPTLRFGNQMKAASEKYFTNKYPVPTNQLVLTATPLSNLPESEEENWKYPTKTSLTNGSIGHGLYTNGELNIDLDFTETAVDPVAVDSYTYLDWKGDAMWIYSTHYAATAANENSAAGLNVYPGVGLTFSVPGKRVKKVVIHTGIATSSSGSRWYMNEYKMKQNLFVILPERVNTYYTQYADPAVNMKFVDNDGKADIVLTSTELFGTTGKISLKTIPLLNSSKNTNGTIPLNKTSAPTTPSLDAPTLNIESVEVEYYDEKPFTATGSHKKTDSFLYFNSSVKIS